MSSVANFTVHEELSVSNRAESVREALDQHIPSVDEQLEFTVYLGSLHETLVEVLSAAPEVMRTNPYFYHAYEPGGKPPEGVIRMRAVRRDLTDTMLQSAERMSDATMAQANSGWTLLMLTWCVVGQLSIAIERVRLADPLWLDGESLERNELLTVSGGIRDVPRMSMREMREALNVLRDRLYMLDTIDAAIMRYILALEHRAAQFAHQTVLDDRDYDCKTWLRTTADGTHCVTNGYVATMAWWFVWLKRHCRWYMNMSRPAFLADCKDTGRIVRVTPETTLTDRRYVISFIGAFAERLNTVDHEQEFLAIAKHYAASPGDIEEHSYVYGMGGIETATVQDIVSKRRTPEATSYIGLRKLKRNLSQWIVSQRARERCSGRGRFVGGGSSCEAFLEQLAVLHVFDQLFVSKMKLRWASWFALLLLPQGPGFETSVKRALVRGMPFVVQRAGRFACVVPRLPDDALLSREAIERRLGIVEPERHYERVAAVMYDGADVWDALTVWTRFMLDAWDGRIEAAAKRSAPLLRRLLKPPAAAATDSSRSAASQRRESNIVRMPV